MKKHTRASRRRKVIGAEIFLKTHLLNSLPSHVKELLGDQFEIVDGRICAPCKNRAQAFDLVREVTCEVMKLVRLSPEKYQGLKEVEYFWHEDRKKKQVVLPLKYDFLFPQARSHFTRGLGG